MKHCPHYSGEAFMTYPARYGVICCQCGARGYDDANKINDPAHGPFQPKAMSYGNYSWKGSEDCPGPKK